MRIFIAIFSVVALFCPQISWGNDFQKVYEVPGLKSEQIKEAFGDPIIDVGMDNLSKMQDIMNTASGQGWKTGLDEAKTGKLRCNISIASWLPAVNEWADADVIFQTKDGKARITVANLQVNGPGKKTCLASIEDHLDARFKLLKKLGDNW